PMWLLRGFGQLRRGRAGRRAKIVHVSTRYTPFSSRVDEWIQVNPGTYGALALGMAHVIISEERYDPDFIDGFTLGFREVVEIDGAFEPGFRDHVLENYSPEKVSSITGVPEKTIIRLSEEFASAKPGVTYGGDGPASYSNAVTELVAIHCLNALVGSIDVPGGIMIQSSPPLKIPKSPEADPLFANNLKQRRLDGLRQVAGLSLYSTASRLPSRLSGSFPYPVEILMLVDLNPVEDLPDSGSWKKALSTFPFVVSFSNFIDETSKLADLIIPPGTFLERWDGKSVDSSTGFPVWGLSRPIFETPLGGMDLSSVILGLTNKMGGRLADLFPWNSSEELLREMASGLKLSPGQSDPWDELVDKGYWSDGPYSFGHQRQVYKTRGNRFNFFMYPLKAAAAELFESGFKSPGATEDGLQPTDFLPNHLSPEFAESGPDYPLHLELFGTTITGHGRFSFLEGLREIQELGINKSWGRWLLMNPDTAEKFRLKEDTEVWVESSTGKILALAKRLEGMREDSVGLVFGQGRGDERRDPRFKATAFSLLAELISPLGGGYSWGGTRVRVYKA
ncbi:MAG: molybdopterin-dependent oxidoreductase, partial [Candidatus Zixiibacteriota bacterium]